MSFDGVGVDIRAPSSDRYSKRIFGRRARGIFLGGNFMPGQSHLCRPRYVHGSASRPIDLLDTNPNFSSVIFLSGQTGFVDETYYSRSLTATGVTRSTTAPIIGLHLHLSDGSTSHIDGRLRLSCQWDQRILRLSCGFVVMARFNNLCGIRFEVGYDRELTRIVAAI